MSFLFVGALAVAGLVLAPLLAHLLRRGRAKEQIFPPAGLVPPERSLAEERTRIEDRTLFGLRAAQILLLSILGAVPLVECSRISLVRDAGASVALAVILDDSLSMQAAARGGSPRFEQAQSAAIDLVSTARRGDAVAVILAGRPARVALAATSDLDAVERTIAELKVTDRATDLAGAVQLARSVLAELPQRDRQLAVFSDLAGDEIPPGSPEPWIPRTELWAPWEDCGVASAERRGSRIEALVVCNEGRAARGRSLEAVAGDPLSEPDADSGPALSATPLAARAGAQSMVLNVPADREILGVRLTGGDAIERDDAASVGRGSLTLSVGVHADPSRGTARTGGPTLVEQALDALGDTSLRPLAILPEDPRELSKIALLVLDDPGGLGPEVRRALTDWISRGGIALALLGPRAERREIGSTLEPFAGGALPWSTTESRGLDSASMAWLGPEAEGFSELAPEGRVRLEGADLPGTRIVGQWLDQRPFLLERELGRGLLLTAGLPSSPDESDFALRPGFIALLDHVVSLARDRSGLGRSSAGDSWRFPAETEVQIEGPLGRLRPRETQVGAVRKHQLFTPEVAGRYRVRTPEAEEERTVSFDPEEIGLLPRTPPLQKQSDDRAERRPEVDASPEVAMLLLLLVAFELALRIARLLAVGRRARAPVP